MNKTLLVLSTFVVLVSGVMAQTSPVIDYQLPANATMEYEVSIIDMEQQRESATTTVTIQKSEGTTAQVMLRTHSYNTPKTDTGNAQSDALYQDLMAAIKKMEIQVKIENGKVTELLNYDKLKGDFKSILMDVLKKNLGNNVNESVMSAMEPMMNNLITPKAFTSQCGFFVMADLPERLNEEKTTTANGVTSKTKLRASGTEGEFLVEKKSNLHLKKDQLQNLDETSKELLEEMNLGEGLLGAFLAQLDELKVEAKQDGIVLRSGIVKKMNTLTKISMTYMGESMDAEIKATTVMK